MIEIKTMNYKDIDKRLSQMPTGEALQALSVDDIKSLDTEVRALNDRRQAIKTDVEERNLLIEKVTSATSTDGAIILESRNTNNGGIKKNMNKESNIEVRSLQKYLLNQDRTQEERSALVSADAGMITPTNIYDELIYDEKYSDLLSRSTIIKDNNRGKTIVPVSAKTNATFKNEGVEMDATTGALTGIELEGWELMRLSSMSVKVASMSASQFQQQLLNLLAEEVIQTLETAFVTGTGTAEPQGLQALTLTDRTVETGGALGSKHIADAISKLSNKFSRNAVILANSSVLHDLMLLTSENDGTMATGATHFLGKEVIENQNLADDEIYIFNPKYNFVKISEQLQIEADRSSSFRKALIDLRALMVVDSKFLPEAVAKVSITV